MTPDEYHAAKAAELAEAAEAHGLTPAEVEAARATGQPLARYAAIKRAPRGVHGASIADVMRALTEAEELA